MHSKSLKKRGWGSKVLRKQSPKSLLCKAILVLNSRRWSEGPHLLVGKRSDAACLVLQAGLAPLLHVAHVPQVPHQHPAACGAHNQPVSRHGQGIHLSRKTQICKHQLLVLKWHSCPKIKSSNHKTMKELADQFPKHEYQISSTTVTQTK